MTSPKASSDQGDYPYFGYFKKNFDYWHSFVTPEPISNDLREKVRLNFQKQWYSIRLDAFRRNIQFNWTRSDSGKILLDSELGEIDTLENARFCCNRPSGFYWSQDIQRAAKREKFRKTPTALFASIFGEWYRQYDNQPNIEFGHFVANPVRITERGPDTIRGIIRAHISLYEKARSMLQDENQWERQKPVEDYKIHLLYPALVLVVDQFELLQYMQDFKRPDGYIRLQDIAGYQSVIIARTKIEEQLSAPISFESLCDKALPLERTDFDGDANLDVIRVSLPDAIRFVVNLEKREDAITHEKMAVSRVDQSLGAQCRHVFTSDGGFCGNRYEWADQHITAAEKHGYQHCFDTAEAVRRVQAESKNEIYLLLSPLWFAPRYIDYEGELGPQL